MSVEKVRLSVGEKNGCWEKKKGWLIMWFNFPLPLPEEEHFNLVLLGLLFQRTISIIRWEVFLG